MTIKAILDEKGSKVVTLTQDTRVSVAVHRLRMEHIGAIVISTNGRRIDGILSERDIVQGLSDHGAEVLDMPVSTLMSHNVITCGPAAGIREVMQLMTSHRIRHMPVVVDGALAGIVSIGDVVKNRLHDMELEANVLRDYAVAHH